MVERAFGFRHNGAVGAAGAVLVLRSNILAHGRVLRTNILLVAGAHIHALIGVLVLIHRKKSPFMLAV